ncbi:MAG: hypothetical protein HFG52_15070 [Lachnospiraceae bacterium]|nr:hypothetical protein [Lachnospiraceae bacterium]
MKVENCPSSKTFLLKIQVKPARVTHNKNSIRKAVAFIFGSFFLQEEIPQNNMVKNIGKKPPDRKMPLLEFVNTNKILKQNEIVPRSKNINVLQLLRYIM